jgi:hypothetical protein
MAEIVRFFGVSAIGEAKFTFTRQKLTISFLPE